MIEYPFAAGETMTRVIEAGDGDRHVVFIHGLGARADRWRRNLDHFADAGYHGYAIDLPGHGFARKGAGFDYGVPGYVDFVLSFLDAMEIDRAAFVGTSLGGHVSAAVACREPARVKALVLVGTLGLAPIGAEAGRAIGDSVRDTSREAIADKLKFVLADPGAITPSWIDEEFRINNSPGAAESFARLGDYLAEEVDRDVVGEQIQALAHDLPIMLVWGTEDRAVPLSVGERAQALLEGVALYKMERAGHAPYFERPEAFNSEVLEFLATTAIVPRR